jgi:hypothetical protein
MWDKMKTANAIKAVPSEEMGLKNIKGVQNTKRTLKNNVNSKETDIEKLIKMQLVWKPVLPYSLEEELVSYCLMTERKFFWLTIRSIKTMAFELAIKNGLARLFSVQQGRAGKKWLCNFMCCHPRLRLRKPQGTSAARVKGFTKANVAKFFNIFVPLLWLNNASPHSLFKYGKTDLSFSIK